MAAKRGQVVLYKQGGLDFLFRPWSPNYSHISIALGNNDAIAARELPLLGKVCHQFADGSDAVYCDVPWKVNFDVVEAWLNERVGKPYDYWAWVRILFGLKSEVPKNRYICSSLVAKALALFSNVAIPAHRETTPDQVARFLGQPV